MNDTYEQYHVVWEIELGAVSPQAAAETALNVQRDLWSQATCFDVRLSSGGPTQAIDLKPTLPGDYWSEDPKFSSEDWQYEVRNNDTRLGYWEWVAGRRETHADEEE